MLYDYLERGVLAGVVAGVAYGAYVALVANPLTEYVHDLEAHGHDDHGHDHGALAEAGGGHEELVSETATAIVSAGSAVLWAVLLGCLFAAAYYFLEPALPGRGAVKGYVLAAAGFFTVSATPWLVLPPAAPGAEYGYGVDARFAIYAGLMVLGAAASAASILGYRRAEPRGRAVGFAAAAAPVLAVVLLVPLVAPTVVAHPELPGELVAAYRGLTALSQAAVWLLVAASFGWLQRRNGAPSEATERREELLASP